MHFEQFLKRSWQEGTEVGIYNVWSTAILGGSAHFIFYFLFKYGFNIYENIYLRSLSVLICVSVVPLYKLKVKWFQIYWHFAVTFVTSFIFTIYLIKSNFNELWIYWEIFMIFVLIMHIPNWFMCLIDLLTGIVAAITYCLIFPEIYGSNNSFNISLYIIVIFFSISGGIIFNYANRKTALNKLKKQHLKLTSLAGSIVHELRNPLNSISMAESEITNNLNNNIENINKYLSRNEIFNSLNIISDSIKSARNIISIILSDLSAKQVQNRDFSIISPQTILQDIINKFGYNNKSEKNKVTINHHPEFHNIKIKAIPDRFSFIIYNLLKNSLYYLKDCPNAEIKLGIEIKQYEGQEFTSIYVYDNGPGIHPDIMPKLFDDFFTSGKKEGTGLGLAFCKRNMKIFGGDIICESEFGKWTKFSLLFPVIKESELNENNNKSKKILIIDDEKVNLITAKSKIQRNLQNISCYIEENPYEALSLIKTGAYDLIITDFEMPAMNGYELSSNIRKENKNIPIIMYSSKKYREFSDEINLENAPFNQYLRKDSSDNVLYRSITKWLNIEDNMNYLGEKTDYLTKLSGKTILIADDEMLNRTIIKKKFKGYGAKVIEVSDGSELISSYVDSLEDSSKISFDLIMSDINMPNLNGDEATKKIRQIEIEKGIHHSKRVPVIALTGDGEQEQIKKYLSCKMTDYFIKGSDPENLVKIVVNYLH